MNYDVFGMCNPLYDIQARVDDSLLDELGFTKGGMFLIDEAARHKLVARIDAGIVNAESGGSGANTMIGLAQLGGSGCYTGKLGADEHGRLYTHDLESKHVTVSAPLGSGPTGICVVLITPDAERTLCTYLGVARELAPADVSEERLRASRYLYVTGYLWDTDSQKAAVLHAMQTARDAGVKVALSLSDPFCVQRHRADFLKIVREHVDVLFGNEEEACGLTETETAAAATEALAPHCELVAVTLGREGSLLQSGDRRFRIPAFKVDTVDTTGAGDMYAAGLLYGLTHNLSLEHSGRLAAYVSGKVVAQMGPRLDTLDLSEFE